MAEPYGAWALDAADYPASGAPVEKLRYLARFGVLAPSVHNSQPWHIDVDVDAIRIRSDARYRLPYADPDGAYLRMSLGMVVENVVVAARWFGHAATVTVAADGTIDLAVSGYGHPRGAIDAAHIVGRTSDKFPYKDAAVPEATLAGIADVAREGDTRIHFVVEPAAKRRIVEAHDRAIARAAANTGFAREVAGMLRANTTRETRGMPGFVAGVGTLPSLIAPPLLRRFPALLPKLVRCEAERVIAHSAGFGFVLSNALGAEADVGAGRAYQRTALLLRQAGIVDALITAAVADAATRADLSAALGLSATPRLLFRFGYSTGPRRHTPREPFGTVSV